MKILQALQKYFGFNSFRQAQQEIIEAIIKGKNVLAVLPTGAGKSICYQIPALVSENFSIVISPLIALMKDQVDALNKNETIAAFINSTMEFYETEKVLLDISYGKIKLLYAAPERLESVSFAERIKKLNPEFLFVDEAHCISEWGHSFRPSYRKINEFARFIGITKISGFTATATPEVVSDIVTQLNLKDPQIFVRGFERKNLNLFVILSRKKKEKVLELISRYKTPAIIYTASRKNAEEVNEYLIMNRINSAYYHAGLAPEIRRKVQEDFLGGQLPVIAATNAFGMGIDKKDIRLIIHYNTPGSIENYYQEIGRAGRDGKESYIFLLHDDQDINIQNYFISNNHPDKELIHSVYNAVCDYGRIAEGMQPDKEIPINIDFISAAAKREVNKGILNSSLKILESGGYLKLLSEFDKKTSMQFNIGINNLREFIKKTTNKRVKDVTILILREYGSSLFNRAVQISIANLSAQSGLDETEIDESLNLLDNLGILSYNKMTAKESILLLQPRVNSNHLILDYKKINEAYIYLQKKLDTMIDYVYSNDCRFKFILKYFGEETKDYKCEKCDKCITIEKLPEATVIYIKEVILRTLYQSINGINETVLIRIIRGTGKRETYLKWNTFGICGNYEKNELLIVLHEMISENLIKRNNYNKKIIELTNDGFEKLKNDGLIEDHAVQDLNYEENLELFNLLREARKKASMKFMQTGNLICSDEILKEIATQKPKTKDEILSVNGFNLRMFNKLGNEFLEIINNFSGSTGKNDSGETANIKKSIPENIMETYKLLSKGYQLKDIASLRKLSEPVVSMQIETILQYDPEVDVSFLFPPSMLDKLTSEIKKGYINLKDLKNRLTEDISYPLIRIAAAKYKASLTNERFTSRLLSSANQDKL